MKVIGLKEFPAVSLYEPSDEIDIAYNDPALNIPLATDSAILSNRDKQNALLSDLLAA